MVDFDKWIAIIKTWSLYLKAERIEKTQIQTAHRVGTLLGTERTREEDIECDNLSSHLLWYEQQIRDIMREGKQLERKIFGD